LAHPQEFSAERRALARDLFHLPGTATIRAVKRIYELLDIEPFLPTQWAIDAGMRQAEEAAAKAAGEPLVVAPFEARGRYPGQAPMV
ncbi:MAG: hypothetical protein HUU25_13745, partial [Candidatus Sumerlaeia bacterium]|nr:hypothetical protein [Candidatus Sumerlaeia bacterium]